uniref:Uncharacterized protein n=1 Tax=Salmo trutta TaxID=8032 RepID=A0A673WIB3_SALTR
MRQTVGRGRAQAVSWRKVLWDRQSFPDNYVDHRFMEELRRNQGPISLWCGRQDWWHNISCVALFLTCWLYMEQVLYTPYRHVSSLNPIFLLCALLDSHQCTLRQYRHGYAMVAFPHTQPIPPGSLSQCCPVCLSLPGLSLPYLLGPGLLSLLTLRMLCWAQLIKLQSDKDNIQGPWDESEIRENLTHFLH